MTRRLVHGNCTVVVDHVGGSLSLSGAFILDAAVALKADQGASVLFHSIFFFFFSSSIVLRLGLPLSVYSCCLVVEGGWKDPLPVVVVVVENIYCKKYRTSGLQVGRGPYSRAPLACALRLAWSVAALWAASSELESRASHPSRVVVS